MGKIHENLRKSATPDKIRVNLRKSAFNALSIFIFVLASHYLTATCRGRIYPSRDMHAHQFKNG
ncbi:MAG: hypothetical protein FWG87_08275 [Defluviitaleaceae bacterium]|nr:hypothetical protein [Defluviitaleaceae bacterium]